MARIETHTPGPWAYEPSSGAIYFADGDVEPVIAGVNQYDTSEEQANADGYLLAAAPQMFAALMALLPEVDAEIEQRQQGGNAEDWNGLQALSDAGHAAIAAAQVSA